MNWITIGNYFYPGYHHLMKVSPYEELIPAEPLCKWYRFILIDEGGGAVQIGGHFFSIAAPSILYLNENDALRPLAGTQIKGRSVYFHPEVVNRKYEFPMKFDERQSAGLTATDLQDLWCLTPFRDTSGCIPIDPMYVKHISQILNEIDEQLAAQPDQSWPCRSRSYMLELLSLVRRLYDRSDLSPNAVHTRSSEQMEQIVQFLHTHYRQKVKVEDVTRAFHTNKTSLNLLFKQSVGLTMMSYLNSIRMQMAASMLRNTTLPSSEIMFMVGIQDSAHFIRNFRKFTGYSPSEYRNQFCWMLK